ncbi:MAG: DUF3443 family protein [Burkholderiaceae bacterium]|nr:DUF3443 family protein [Burkholderiaceae bacterium]
MLFRFKSLALIIASTALLAACGGGNSNPAGQAAQSKQLHRSEKAQVSSDYQNVLEQLYVAYYGRPADPAGMVYWEGVLLAAGAPTDIAGLNSVYSNPAVKAVVDSFGNSAESVALYGSGNSSGFINAIYENILGRSTATDTAGAQYWSGLLANGTMTQAQAALAILAAAASEPSSSSDEQVVANRLVVANYFTTQTIATGATAAYSGNAVNGPVRTMLGTVGATTDTTAFQATVNTTIAAFNTANVSNSQAIIVDSGPAGLTSLAINEVFTSVTVCAPASPTLCQTIDHVLVDTGSYGLRLLASALSPSLAAALQPSQINGRTLSECTLFADGYSWGPIKFVNLQIAGETANNLPTQIIGDTSIASAPTECTHNGGTSENTVSTFGSNGVIGVGLFQQDCGPGCVGAANTVNGNYFTCTTTSCSDTAATLDQQVPNPVYKFAKDNNGVIISLPALPSSGGASTVSGTMYFGVGTQSNNALGSASVFQMSSDQGYFSTIYAGQTEQGSFIDSGSNGLYFYDPTNIATCSDNFFCPSSQLSLSATMVGTNGVQQVINFGIGNADSALALNPNWTAYLYFGAPNPSTNKSFDWGLPFFYGRNVIVVTENQSVFGISGNKVVTGQTGPFVAF